MKQGNRYLSLGLKLILILSILNAINLHLWHIASTNIFLLALTFAPQILKSQTKLKIPNQFELLLFIFVIATLLAGKVSGIIAPILFGVGTGLIALLILLILYCSNTIKKNYFLILSYAFFFSMTFGVALELAKYYLKLALGHSISSPIYTMAMMNLTYVLIGSVVAITIGYIYMKTHFSFIRKIINKLKKSNPELFKKINSIDEIIEEVKKGESETQEFKSTLRTNLHTNGPDKKIEFGILKTITSFMNTSGGVLYIGITDEGKVLGIEKDNFENPDKFGLHLTNIIKQKIGKTNSINIEILKIKDRHIARIEVKKTKKPTFLKDGKDEMFFVRIGPQTQELKGSEFLTYFKLRFEKKK